MSLGFTPVAPSCPRVTVTVKARPTGDCRGGPAPPARGPAGEGLLLAGGSLVARSPEPSVKGWGGQEAVESGLSTLDVRLPGLSAASASGAASLPTPSWPHDSRPTRPLASAPGCPCRCFWEVSFRRAEEGPETGGRVQSWCAAPARPRAVAQEALGQLCRNCPPHGPPRSAGSPYACPLGPGTRLPLAWPGVQRASAPHSPSWPLFRVPRPTPTRGGGCWSSRSGARPQAKCVMLTPEAGAGPSCGRLRGLPAARCPMGPAGHGRLSPL